MKKFTEKEIDRIIEMAWEDRTPFEAIYIQFNLSEKKLIELMRKTIKPKSFKIWRSRVKGNKIKEYSENVYLDSNRVLYLKQFFSLLEPNLNLFKLYPNLIKNFSNFSITLHPTILLWVFDV